MEFQIDMVIMIIIFRNHLEVMSNAKGDDLMRQVLMDCEDDQ